MDRKTDGRLTQRDNKTRSGGQTDRERDKEIGRQTDIVGGFDKTGKKCLSYLYHLYFPTREVLPKGKAQYS